MKKLRNLDVYFCELQGLMSEFDMLCRVLLIPRRSMLEKLIADVDKDSFPLLYKHISHLLSVENDWFKALCMRNFWTHPDDYKILASFVATFECLISKIYSKFGK